jgi:hypothetical protein
VGAVSGALGGKRASPSLKGKCSHLDKFAKLMVRKRLRVGSVRRGLTYPHSDPSCVVIGAARYQIGESRVPTMLNATRPIEFRASSMVVAAELGAASAVAVLMD